MKSTIKLLSLLALLATALPTIGFGADKTPASADTKTEGKSRVLGFHGPLGAITDKQVTIKYAKGEKNYVIASSSQILDNKDDKKPAKISDAKVGSEVSGSYTKGADGTLTIVHLYVAPKAKEKDATPAKTTTDSTTATTTDTPKKKKKKPSTDTPDTTTPPKSN